MIIKLIIETVAFVLIWIAVDYKRCGNSKIEFLSKDWFVQYLLLVVAVITLKYIS